MVRLSLTSVSFAISLEEEDWEARSSEENVAVTSKESVLFRCSESETMHAE